MSDQASEYRSIADDITRRCGPACTREWSDLAEGWRRLADAWDCDIIATRLLEIERDSNKRLADTLAGCEYQRNQLIEQLRQSQEECSKAMLDEMDRLRGEVLELRDKLKRTVTYRHVGPLVPPPYSMDDRDDD